MSSKDTDGALARIRRYLDVRAKVKMLGTDDVIHAVHTGTEHEAELRLSDLAAVLSAPAAPVENSVDHYAPNANSARPGVEDAEPAAAETWFTYPKMVQHDGRVAFVRTPPGLYLSKGDGEIVPVAAPADAGAARVAELVEATTAIVDHPGIKVTCEDLDAKAAWDRLGEAIAALAAGQDAGERG